MRGFYDITSNMMGFVTADVMFVLGYILFVICVLHPPAEVVSAGFTIPILFERYVGAEHVDFIMFHIRRTVLTLLIYAILPFLFTMGLNVYVTEETQPMYILITNYPTVYSFLSALTYLSPTLALVQVYSYRVDWADHPLAITLKKFANNNTKWEQIGADVNNEFRSIEKTVIKTGGGTTVIATENWIIKVNTLSVSIAHQSDASLTVLHSDTADFGVDNPSATQYITIEVKSNRVDPFTLRLNALDFQELQDRITRVINVLPDVRFQRSITEQFTEAFKQAIQFNIKYVPPQEVDVCIGCMQSKADIKLQKYCTDGLVRGLPNCTACYCKPMWCVDCLATWFAHRQDIARSATWLSAKCTCPTCRATFCVLDVCPIVPVADNAG